MRALFCFLLFIALTAGAQNAVSITVTVPMPEGTKLVVEPIVGDKTADLDYVMRIASKVMVVPDDPCGDPPKALIIFGASDGTYPDKVRISWTLNTQEATYYEIWRSETDDSGTAAQVGGLVTTQPYDDYTVVAPTVYYYWIKAYNDCGTEGFSLVSDSGWAIDECGEVPADPTALSATDGTTIDGYADKVDISWTLDPEADDYALYRSETDDSGTAAQIGASWAASPATDSTVVSGTLYYYWLKATNICGTSSFSTVSDSGYAGACYDAPDVPVITASDDTYTDKVRVNWTPDPYAVSYEVWKYTSDDSGSASQIGGTITDPPYDDEDVSVDVDYWYWVKAVNTCGTSAFSAGNKGTCHLPEAFPNLDGWAIDAATGWLDILPSAASTTGGVPDIFYVSTTGSDSNNGLSSDAPFATPSVAFAAAAGKYAPWVLFKRGDVWFVDDEDETDEVKIRASGVGGVSKTAPYLIGAYGTGARPLLFHLYLGAPPTIQEYVVVRDLHLVMNLETTHGPVYIENCWFGGTGFEANAYNGDPAASMALWDDSTINRCIHDDHYYTGSDARRTGIYTTKDSVTITGCYFYGNRDRTRIEIDGQMEILSNQHAVYAHRSTTNLLIDNCIAFLIMPGAGLAPRGPSTVTNNLTYRLPRGTALGHDYNYTDLWPSGLPTSLAQYNVNIDCGMPNEILTDGCTIADNIMISQDDSYQLKFGLVGFGAVLERNTIYGGYLNIGSGTSYTFTDNVFVKALGDWAVHQDTGSGTAVYTNNVFSGSGNYLYYNGSSSSDLSAFEIWAAGSGDNAYVADPGFLDPERDLEKYLEVELGMGAGTYANEGAAWAGFVAIMRGQDKDDNPASPNGWETQYEAKAINAYIREGFTRP